MRMRMRMATTKMKQLMVTVVRESERREAAEERPQAGQDAVAVPEKKKTTDEAL